MLAEVLKNSHDDKELIACCNALSLLCFCNKGSLLIDENEDLKDSLFDLEVSITHRGVVAHRDLGNFSVCPLKLFMLAPWMFLLFKLLSFATLNFIEKTSEVRPNAASAALSSNIL